MTPPEGEEAPAPPAPRAEALKLLGAYLLVVAAAGLRPWRPAWGAALAIFLMLALPLALAPRPRDLVAPGLRRAGMSALEGLSAALVLLPLFFAGAWLLGRFNLGEAGAGRLAREAPFQLFAVALPEELFFRAFLQARLEALGSRKVRLLGARLGWGWPLAAALFALAHLAATGRAGGLLVFFPGLVFGWLWARRRSIAGPVVFHALCNLSLLWTPGLL